MRTRILFILTILCGGAHLAGATSAEAQVTLSRSTVDGGGGRSTGGSFSSIGTAGQADAGVLAGGTFRLTGGFWIGGSEVSGIADGTDDGIPPAFDPSLVFHIYPANPNPMSEQTTVSFQLPEPTRVRAEIFDASGRLVRVLTDDVLAAGRHDQTWDRRDQSGIHMPAGIYFVRLDAGGRGSRQKIVVLS
ncbi:MAG: FlgD immunoglobulin-like domain containing protein [Candidatus Eisenbacteria bacterium]